MRRNAVIASLAVVIVTAAACSGEDAAESFLENAIEQEGGGDVDLDFGSDGGFSIDTGEGSMSIDEDGNFVITDENGEVITGDVDVDGDGGVTIESDEGNFSMESDGDGSTTFQSDDGEMTINAVEGVPEEWPADVPAPSALAVESGSSAVTGETSNLSVVGTATDGEDWVAVYGAQLVDAGFDEQFNMSSPGGLQVSFLRGSETVSIIATENSGQPWDVIVSYFRDGS